MVLLTGCAVGEEHPSGEISSPPSEGVREDAPTVEPTFDPESGLWLGRDGPVPAPDATFDPNDRWQDNVEANAAVAECLRGAGWDVTVLADEPTGFSLTIPPGQKDAFDAASKQCRIDLRIGINPARPLEESWVKEEYAAQEELRECLVAQGVDVPPLPTYQSYAEKFLADEDIFDLYWELGSAIEVQHRGVCPDPMNTFGFNG